MRRDAGTDHRSTRPARRKCIRHMHIALNRVPNRAFSIALNRVPNRWRTPRHSPARSVMAATADGARGAAAIEADVAPGTPIDPSLTTSLLHIVTPQVAWLRIIQTLELEDIIFATNRAKACEACLTHMRERVCAEYRDRRSVKTLEEQLDAAKARLQEAVQVELKAERQMEDVQQRLQKAEAEWGKAAKKASAAGGGTVCAAECAAHSIPVVKHGHRPP